MSAYVATEPSMDGAASSDGDFKAFMDALPAIVFATTPDGANIYVNRFYQEFTGLPDAALLGDGWIATIHPEDGEAAAAASGAAFGSGKLDAEYRFRRHDGGYRWFLCRANPVRDDQGRITHWIGVCTDIEDRKRTEAALAESEALFRRFADANVVGVATGDVSGRVFYANDAFLRVTGWTREQLAAGAVDWIGITPPEHRQKDEVAMLELERDGVVQPFEKEYQRVDGRRVPVLVGVARITADRHMCTVVDLSAIKSAEAALRASEERLRLAVDGAGMGTWDMDLVTRTGVWSQAFFDITGVPPTPGGAADLQVMLDRIHPDDLPRLQAAVQQARRTGRLVSEHRILRADNGEVRWGSVFSRYLPVPDPVRNVGVFFDVTARKEAELELELQRRQLAEQVAELEALYATSPVGLALIDTELRYRRINAKLAEIYGISAADHLGRTVREIVPDLTEQAEAALRRILETGEPLLDFEITGETPAQPGVERVWREDWVPLRKADGTIGGISIVAEEVTERRRAEERRRTLVNELNHRVKNTLATVQAIASQTFGRESAPIVDAFSARLIALSDAQDVLTREDWEGADLRDVVTAALSPHRGHPAEDRFAVSGPPVRLDAPAALGLALALHELCTNAAKYGALSRPGGRVEVSWTLDEAGRSLSFEWRESGGPLVQPPARRGFGSRLIERALADDLKGEARLHFNPAGLVCRLQAKLR